MGLWLYKSFDDNDFDFNGAVVDDEVVADVFVIWDVEVVVA